MKARKLATICALLAAMSNLIGCESSRSSRSPNAQFQKQVMRAQECRQLQDKLVGGEPLTPERRADLATVGRRFAPSDHPAIILTPIRRPARADEPGTLRE